MRLVLPAALVAFAAALPTFGPAVHAGQTLIPTPYPTATPGALPLDPEPGRLGGPQRLMKDPYPQTLGDFAQGNPSISRVRHHQRLVPTLNERKYRVDQIPQYYR